MLARASGERRLANLRKLMRLAREYERAEGRDLHGFLAYAATRDFAAAREGEAPLESEGLDAVRLMTIHRAKGLEFPVVCVADLGRQGAGQRDRLLIGPDGEVGLRLATPGGGETLPALAFERLADAAALEEDAEERRLFYVAMTRARDRLILSGSTDPERHAEPRPGGPPLDWIAPALLGGALDPARPERVVTGVLGRPADARARRGSSPRPRSPRPRCSPSRGRRPGTPGTALPARAEGRAGAAPPRSPPRSGSPTPPSASTPAARTASTSSARCACPTCARRQWAGDDATPPPAAAPALDPRVRGTIAHRAARGPRLRAPRRARPRRAWSRSALEAGAELTPEDVEDIRGLVAAFGASPLCARLAAARDVRREAGFAFRLDPAGGALVNGFVDVLAREADDTMLIVDYKSDRLDGAEPEDVVEASYATQRIVYALAALREGAPAVEVAYCFLERPEVAVAARFTQRDIARARRAPDPARRGRARAPPPRRRRAPPRPLRRLPRPRDAVLVAGGDDAARARAGR